MNTSKRLPPEVKALTFRRHAGPHGKAFVYGAEVPIKCLPGTGVVVRISVHAWCPSPNARLTKRQLAAFVKNLKFLPTAGIPK
ncbi:MAG: hypothetical protein NTW01_05570 [Gammaproteobacteria bacterium]|nr:hypothetical protein [Gammaproteobacteria bacterium]